MKGGTLMRKILVVLLCFCLSLTSCTVSSSDDIYLVLVNKQHQVPDDWESQITLVSDQDPWGNEVEKETLEQFNKLKSLLLKQEGIDIRLDSNRSIPEHQTGLAVDICLMLDEKPVNDNDALLAETEAFKIIHGMMPYYGFILRYPQGKEDITGYTYMPWHLRYVGVDNAIEITSKNQTLEEYLSSP